MKIPVRYNLDYFLDKRWSFVLIKKDKLIYKSKFRDLKPLIFCVKKYRRQMRGAIVFDKIVGRAAAILLAYVGIREVWTSIVSMGGKRCLLKNKVKLEYDQKVKNIMNRRSDDFCPMEKLSRKMPRKEFIERMLK